MSYAARETAFADNLHSMASSHKVLQRKADIVSAICCVMGLQLSVKNFRDSSLPIRAGKKMYVLKTIVAVPRTTWKYV